jgi:hypothetical protein
MKINIATWMYTHAPGYKSLYPQGGDVTSLEAQLTYWRCCFCLFHSSSVLHGRDAVNHLLYVNAAPPEFIDGMNIKELSEALSIDYRLLLPRARIPEDYCLSFTTQFYLVDILEDLAEGLKAGRFGMDDVFLVLDSDCLFHKPIPSQLVEDVRKHGCLPYAIFTAEADDGSLYHGTTFEELMVLTQEYSGDRIYSYFLTGGEFMCLHASQLLQVAAEARAVFQTSIDRHKRGLKKFHTDEAMFGYIFARRGYPRHLAEQQNYLRRIYTHPQSFQFEQSKDDDVVIWHLLNEKRRLTVLYFYSLKQSLEGQRILEVERMRNQPLITWIEPDISEPAMEQKSAPN